jgi:hypothetical protein
MRGPVITVDPSGDLYVAGSTTTGGSTYENDHVITVYSSGPYYHLPVHNGMSELPSADRSDVYVMKINGADGSHMHGTFYGGRSGVPLNQPGWSIDQDVVTCITERDPRLFIGGSTASILFFPVAADDGVNDSFLQYTPPINQIAGATDLTQGSIAQLSWLFTSVEEFSPADNRSLVAFFDDQNRFAIQLPANWQGPLPQVALYDAQGKLVLSVFPVRNGQRLELSVPGLASGIYVGQMLGTRYIFKAIKP